MCSHSQDSPHTLSTPEMNNSTQQEEEHLFPRISYAIPHEELNQFSRITRSYTQKFGSLLLALLHPHRKQVSRPVVDNPN
jgi:hypothetical protein